jgi:hypothetical protein
LDFSVFGDCVQEFHESAPNFDLIDLASALGSKLQEQRAGRIVRHETFPDSRTPISLVAGPTTKCPRPRAATSVVNRYYDPTTDQFLSIDPDVMETGQPYVFTNDDPLNGQDPLGLCWPSWACGVEDAIGAAGSWVAHHPLEVVEIVGLTASVVATGGTDAAFVGLTIEASGETQAALSTAETIAKAATYIAAGADSAKCLASRTAGACAAAAASAATAIVVSLPGGANVVVKAGKTAVAAVVGTGSTALDVSITLSKTGKLTIKTLKPSSKSR